MPQRKSVAQVLQQTELQIGSGSLGSRVGIGLSVDCRSPQNDQAEKERSSPSSFQKGENRSQFAQQRN